MPMAKQILVKLVRLLGWVLFIINLIIVLIFIIGILFNSENFDFVILWLTVFFAGFAGFGFFLTRYKKGKKTDPPVKKEISEEKLPPVAEEIEDGRNKLGVPKSKVFHIVYKNLKGWVTERDIEIIGISEKAEKLYIHAFCHLKLEIRTFLASQIISMTENGQRIEDIRDYLQRNFTPPSAEDLANIALDDTE